MSIPVTGPGRSSLTRQQLDDALANVAAGLGEYLSDVSAARRLAETIAAIPADVLTNAPDDAATPGFGYTTEQAYSVGLFGTMLTTLLAWWTDGTPAAAQTGPTAAAHALKFVGV